MYIFTGYNSKFQPFVLSVALCLLLPCLMQTESVITVQQHFSHRMALNHLQQKLNFVSGCEAKKPIGQTWLQFGLPKGIVYEI